MKFIFVSVSGCKLPYLAGKPKVFVFISFKYGDQELATSFIVNDVYGFLIPLEQCGPFSISKYLIYDVCKYLHFYNNFKAYGVYLSRFYNYS